MKIYFEGSLCEERTQNTSKAMDRNLWNVLKKGEEIQIHNFNIYNIDEVIIQTISEKYLREK